MKALMMGAAVLICTAANAQFWKAMGKGPVGPYAIQRLFCDSLADRLLACGSFVYIKNDLDTLEAHGQAQWNGTRWDSLANRITPAEGQTYWFLRYQGELYSCGANGFITPEGDVNWSLARLNEQTQYWEALECLNSPSNGLIQLVPRFPNPVLYATGYPGSLCDQETNSVYVYDGSTFTPWTPFDQVEYDSDNYVGSVFDYKGKTYVSGDYRDPLGPGYSTFMRWSGTEWEYVPGWNNTGVLRDFLIHNDTLYVTGLFNTTSGAPGNLVASFDGDNWSNMGGGLSWVPSYPYAAGYSLGTYQGDLLVTGVFNKAGNADVHCIASWNGQQWCGFPGDFEGTNVINSTAVWRDTLYICGGFTAIDGVPMKQVAQWIGGDAVGNCSSVGIAEHNSGVRPLSITPLEGSGVWMIKLPEQGNWTVTAYDATGKLAGHWRTNGATQPIDLSEHWSGLYLLRATEASGAVLVGKVLR